MADTAFQKQYRQEQISAFEFTTSMLRATTTTEMMRQGNEAIFLVAGSGGAEATTRGVNGLIPSRADDLTQLTCTLQEWHDKVRKTRFNVFASQSDQRKIMQETSAAVINRKVDDIILTELNTGTVNTGTAATASLALVTKAQTILGNADVDIEQEENMYGVISPAFRAYMLRDDSFASADYVEVKPLVGPAKKMLRWAGVNWIVHSRVPGVGTSAEKCFLFHKNAIGSAMDTKDIKAETDYNSEDDYSWARSSIFCGAKLLQNSGVVVMNHDGSALVAA